MPSRLLIRDVPMSGVSLSHDIVADAIVWRHHLHQHPELAFMEQQTSDFIATLLDTFGLTVHRGLAGTGVVGTLTRGTGGKTLAIRADMDALPIEEHSGASHASSASGIMHACGHDGHVAIALAAARACSQLQNLDGTVHFIFQPGEEGAGGAKRMIEDGLFERFPCERVYALHNQPAIPFGRCVVRDGVMYAACAEFEVTLSGRGCHAGRPHQGTDVLLAGCQLVSAVQSIVSRNIDPLEAAVLSATQIRAGEAFNVVPDRCVIRGTARWFDERTGEVLERRLNELASSIAAGFGCGANVSFNRIIPATINDPAAANLLRRAATAVPQLSLMDHPPTTGAEDFSEMLKVVPGALLWLGGGRSAQDPGLHSPRYDFNDDLLPVGAALWVSLVQRTVGEAASGQDGTDRGPAT